MKDEHNPYAAPTRSVVSASLHKVDFNAEGVVLAEPPHARSAGEGAAWVSEGWELFKRQPAALVGFILVTGILYAIGAGILQFLPIIGSVLASMYGFILLAGVSLTIDRLYRGEEVSFNELFAGFTHPARNALALFGAAYAVASMGISFLAALLVGVLPFWKASVGLGDAAPETLLENGGMEFLLSMGMYVMVMLLLLLPLMMGSWFASVLMLFHGLSPMQAFNYGIRAVLRNVLPLTIQSLLFWLLMIASIFTLFLGLLVLIPMMATSWYISYRRVCTNLAATATL